MVLPLPQAGNGGSRRGGCDRIHGREQHTLRVSPGCSSAHPAPRSSQPSPPGSAHLHLGLSFCFFWTPPSLPLLCWHTHAVLAAALPAPRAVGAPGSLGLWDRCTEPPWPLTWSTATCRGFDVAARGLPGHGAVGQGTRCG